MSIASALKSLFSKPCSKVSAVGAAKLVDRGAALLDVRETHEWQAGHAPKARHLPLGQQAQRAREIPTARPSVTICRSGARSARAAAMLAREGRPVSNVAGGMHAWARADLPVVAKGGRPGQVV